MRRLAPWALVSVIAAPALATAQGFGVNELGTCTMERAGVAAASPCADGSAIWFNPAGLAALGGTHVSASGTLIIPHGGFTADYTLQQTDMLSQSYLVPSIYVTRALGSGIVAGIGLYAPYGLGTKWDPSFIGSFDGYNTQVRSVYVQPTVGYQVTKKLSLGLGVAYVHSTVELHQRIDLSQQIAAGPITFAALGIPAYTPFADAALTASGNGVAINFGGIYQVTDRLSIGGHFLTRTTITYDGHAAFVQVPTNDTLPAGNPITGTVLPLDVLLAGQFQPTAPLSDSTAHTTITLPDQGSIGLAYKVNDQWSVMGEYQRTMWGWLPRLKVTFDNPNTPPLNRPEGFRDASDFRVGVEYRRDAKTTIRAGYLYNTAASPDSTVTPLLPESDRNELTLGLGREMSAGLRLELAYQYVRQNARRGRAGGLPQNNGLYKFGANLFGAGLSYAF